MNKKPNKGSFSSTNQPKPRGKAERGKILDALKRASHSEDSFYDLLIKKAFSNDDAITFKELLSRMSPVPKAVAPTINFEFPENEKPHIQAACVMKAVADGDIPPDIGATFISSIKYMIDIEEYTDLKSRIESIEKALSISSD